MQRCGPARDLSPRSAASSLRRSTVARAQARAGRRRSGRRASTRKARCRWRSSDSSSRSSSATRSTVATTRSKSRKPRVVHEPYANRPCRSYPCSWRRMTTLASCARRSRACSGQTVERPRAHRRRRRIHRRDAELLAGSDDQRLVVLRNKSRPGSPRRSTGGSTEATGRYVARLDADDVALPERLERQLARMKRGGRSSRSSGRASSTSMQREPGGLHCSRRARRACAGTRSSAPRSSTRRCSSIASVSSGTAALRPGFSRERGLRPVDAAVRVRGGRQPARALVYKRVHPGQASLRRGELQQSFQRQVALREIARIAPELSAQSKPSSRGGSGAAAIRRLDEGGGARVPRAARRIRGSVRSPDAHVRAGGSRERSARKAVRRDGDSSPCAAQVGAAHVARPGEPSSRLENGEPSPRRRSSRPSRRRTARRSSTCSRRGRKST